MSLVDGVAGLRAVCPSARAGSYCQNNWVGIPDCSLARTLVIAGDNDLLALSSINSEMVRLTPNDKLEILPCGHMSTVEASNELAETMQGWFERQRVKQRVTR